MRVRDSVDFVVQGNSHSVNKSHNKHYSLQMYTVQITKVTIFFVKKLKMKYSTHTVNQT